MKLFTAMVMVVVGGGSVGSGQMLVVPPGPIAPGSTIPVTIFNNTTTKLAIPGLSSALWLQHADGSAVTFPVFSDLIAVLPPSTSTTVLFLVPASGPGSNGSFAIRLGSAARRLDVGTQTLSFPSIHVSPANIFNRDYGHCASLGSWGLFFWEISNTSTSAHTFGLGDQIKVYSPGGSVPLLVTSLAGYAVAAGGAVSGRLSLTGLLPGPYTFEATWVDPATNSVVVARHGIRDFAGIDMQLPGGHVIPAGGVLPVVLNLVLPPVTAPPIYAFCIGVLPGTTSVPGGNLFPLAFDAAVIASLIDGIGGLLIANIGTAQTSMFPPLFAGGGAAGGGARFIATGIGVSHPGLPAFSGMTVRAAAIAYAPSYGSSIFALSQGEDLLIQ